MKIGTKKLVMSALLVALSVVLTRLLSLQITESIRISLGNLPILIAGCLLGPIAGAAVGLVADVLGATLLSSLGWYPPLAVSPILVGLISGLLAKKLLIPTKYWRFLVLTLLCNIAAPILWTTFFLSKLYGTSIWTLLSVRVPLYLCMTALESVLLFQLIRLLRPLLADTPKMTYEQALSYVHAVQWRGSRLGLSRTRELMRLIGSPEKHLKFVHIAGTNGKGSTAAMLASVLQAAGYRTGLYTSPFLERFNERIQINGVQIPDEKLAALTYRIRPLADSMEDPPTEFELITALGLLYFEEERCDIVVLEVGLGGELDSTNVIPTPEVAVITALGLDHTRELGGTIEQIAQAKAGIIKQDGRVVFYGGDTAAEQVIRETCAMQHASLAFPDSAVNLRLGNDRRVLFFDCGSRKNLRIPLLGAYQPHNAAVVLKTIALLQERGWHIPEAAVYEGLSCVVWHGRFEALREHPLFLLDGGHNPQGVQATVDSFRQWFPDRKAVCLIGMMADKDVDAAIRILRGVSDVFCTIRPDNKRALDAKTLALRIRATGAEATACETICEGVEKSILLAGDDGIVLAVGSLYMSGDVRACVMKE